MQNKLTTTPFLSPNVKKHTVLVTTLHVGHNPQYKSYPLKLVPTPHVSLMLVPTPHVSHKPHMLVQIPHVSPNPSCKSQPLMLVQTQHVSPNPSC